MTKRIGIYAGTFDPITLGHLDIIQRGTQIVDRLIVGVASATGKECLFSTEERKAMVAHEVAQMPHDIREAIEVKSFSNLLVDFARENKAGILIRGMRVVSDFEYEFQMACMNSRLNHEVETIFLTASESTQFISSRFVKQICQLGGDVSTLVSSHVEKQLRQYYKLHPHKECA